ncbi:hypothetical protein GGF44_003473 [Coemansia sp. RSA 1694]|nr:hypothetical protein GGF38_001338 [Coemansia sp. RSA 25]KAJ2557882.1 hypothetical protein GGH95_005093 [Coemansia sp. RSA 1836]KAJ2634734.1 hypothetical protein GGF44_003473 [Coemansia sp. RSA 1694]
MPPCPFDLVRDTPFGSYTASAAKLTGGLINYVWRLADASGDTVIVKYADSSLAVLPEVKFSVERMDFEVRGLSLFNELSSANQASETLRAINSLSAKSLAPTTSVRVPKLLYYDASQHFLILEDVGVHMGYEAWYVSKDSGPADIDFVCAKVGEWLAHLHAFGFANLAFLESHFVNQPARDLLSGLMYDSTAQDIKAHTQFDDKQELADRVMQLKTELRQAKVSPGVGHTLLFGDMWPGSILFDVEARIINVLDFEFADIGLIYGDLGHFVAHLLPMHFLRDKSFNPNTDPCPHSVVAFLSAYKQTMLEKNPEAYRAAIGDAVRHSTMFMGIEIARDVLTGNWCRCENAGPKSEKPLTCECAEILLPLARKYINNPSDSLFNILN